ncbi:MAG: HIT family protein [Deltaproteobacteria bacterium]
MKPIWAPWRIDYITGEKRSGCVFCDKPKEGSDRGNLILFQGVAAFIIMNRYPYTNGHLMVVPYRHTSELSELDAAERLEIMNLAARCVQILECIKPDGFNIGMNLGRVAGAGIDEHLHLHIVPRWSGDTNFMPVIADVKVMPEYLGDTYAKLYERLKSEE